MLAPVSEALLTEQPLLHLGLASAAAYPQFVAELQDSSGVDPGYHRCGTLLAARDADEAEALGRELAMRTRLGLAVTRLRASEARQLEPALAPVLRLALEIPDDHAIDPRRLTSALAIALARAGGELRNRVAVTGLTVDHGRVSGVVLATRRDARGRAGRRRHRRVADRWPSAGGAGPAAARSRVRSCACATPAAPGLLKRVVRLRGAYIVPRGDGRYVVGATMEERGFDTTVTAGAVYELLRDASELVPGLAELVLEEVSAGLRPASPDNAPVIGPGAIAGLHWAAGHYRHGVLLAPITADGVVRDAGRRGARRGPGPVHPAALRHPRPRCRHDPAA